MPTYTFGGYRGSAKHRFTCPSCERPNRVRTFTIEHTVNPFNKNDDGSVKTAAEVSAGAYAEAKLRRDQFATEPLCGACEDSLAYAERTALGKRRKDAPAPTKDSASDGSEG